MKNQKASVCLSVLVVFLLLLSACSSGPKTLDFNALDTRTFVMTYLSYHTNMEEYNEKIPAVFLSLPIEKVLGEVESEYGIEVDTYLFDDMEKSIGEMKSYNLLMPNYFIEQKPEKNFLQQVSVTFLKMKQNEALEAIVSFTKYKDGQVIEQIDKSVSVAGWKPF